jgi:hypothetical protein
MVVVLPAPFGPEEAEHGRGRHGEIEIDDATGTAVRLRQLLGLDGLDRLQIARLAVATLRPAAVRFLREMLDRRVTRREEEPDVAVVAPLHEVRRRAIITMNLEDLRVAVRLADVMSLDDQPVSYRCLHRALPSPRQDDLP